MNGVTDVFFFFLQNTSCIGKSQDISQGVWGGVECTLCTRLALCCIIATQPKQLMTCQILLFLGQEMLYCTMF